MNYPVFLVTVKRSCHYFRLMSPRQLLRYHCIPSLRRRHTVRHGAFGCVREGGGAGGAAASAAGDVTAPHGRVAVLVLRRCHSQAGPQRATHTDAAVLRVSADAARHGACHLLRGGGPCGAVGRRPPGWPRRH